MKKESINETDLFLAFSQIVEGCSEKKYRGNPIFIKHIGLIEKTLYNKKYKFFFENALSKGLLKEEDALQKAMDEDFWSEKDEEEIKTSRDYIERMFITKKKLFKKLQIEEVQKTINEEQGKLSKKIAQKKEVLGKTAEDYANNRASDYLIFGCFYKDKALSEKLFSEEEFEEMSTNELHECINIYNDYFLEISDLKIQKIAISDFFQPNYLVLDRPTDLFGQPMVKLSENQIRLIIYGKIFKNIFETVEHIPENVKKDPEALLEYKDKGEAKKEFETKTKNKKRGNTDGAEMVFNATKEDLGGEAKSLKDVMGDKNILTMDDLIKLHGD